MDEMDFHALQLRYRNALEAYRALAARNADQSDGHNPSIEQLRDEQQALDVLAQARRELLSALGTAAPPQSNS